MVRLGPDACNECVTSLPQPVRRDMTFRGTPHTFDGGTPRSETGFGPSALQISPCEACGGHCTDEHEICDGPESQPDAALLRAPERPEPEQETRQA
jgi:hypothetical protein